MTNELDLFIQVAWICMCQEKIEGKPDPTTTMIRQLSQGRSGTMPVADLEGQRSGSASGWKTHSSWDSRAGMNLLVPTQKECSVLLN